MRRIHRAGRLSLIWVFEASASNLYASGTLHAYARRMFRTRSTRNRVKAEPDRGLMPTFMRFLRREFNLPSHCETYLHYLALC